MKFVGDGSTAGGLVISRRVGERILIGDDIVIRVTEVRGGQARLQIIAPKSVRINRPNKEEDARDRAMAHAEDLFS